MIGEQMEGFIHGLIEKTKKQELDWKPLVLLPQYDSFIREINEIHALFDRSLLDSVVGSTSYYISHKDGYVVLCNAIVADENTGIQHNSLFLFTKINPYYPLDDSGNFPDFQKDLEVLKLLIEKNIYADYSMPAALYNFWYDII